MPVDVLAIMAHRDDAEIICGGTLIKMADLGHATGILDLTEGEMGTRGRAEDRAKEAEEAARVMKLAHRENAKLPDAGVELTPENKRKVAEVIRRLRPRVVILPYWEERHPDHRLTSQLGFDACYLAGLKKLPLPGEAHRPHKIVYCASFRTAVPNFVVDITDQFERKVEAIRCYRSQFLNPQEHEDRMMRGREAFERIEARARHWGSLIGKRYGEPFAVKELFEIEDLLHFPVASI